MRAEVCYDNKTYAYNVHNAFKQRVVIKFALIGKD